MRDLAEDSRENCAALLEEVFTREEAEALLPRDFQLEILKCLLRKRASGA